MARWRLLLVSEPGRDGVFFVVRDLIRHLHAFHPEVAVDLAYSSLRGSEDLLRVVEEVEAHGGRTVDLLTGNAPQRADLAALQKLRRLIRETPPDVVHAHSSKAGALVRLLALSPGFPPVLYTPHAYYGLPRKGGRKEFFFNLIEAVLGRIGYTQNCSADERDFALECLRIPVDRLTVIHNGIDTNRFVPALPQEKAKLRADLGIPPDGRLLVTVGRVSYQKNYEALYATLDRVLPQGAWRFAHAGAGSEELRATLGSAAADRATAFAFLQDPVRLLQAADVFVLPSRYEGLSLSMLEALSCGLAVILTEAPGLRELKRLPFPSVRWLPDPAAVPSITPYLETTLAEWRDLTPGESAAQREQTFHDFNSRTQLEKVAAFYTRLKR